MTRKMTPGVRNFIIAMGALSIALAVLFYFLNMSYAPLVITAILAAIIILIG